MDTLSSDPGTDIPQNAAGIDLPADAVNVDEASEILPADGGIAEMTTTETVVTETASTYELPPLANSTTVEQTDPTGFAMSPDSPAAAVAGLPQLSTTMDLPDRIDQALEAVPGIDIEKSPGAQEWMANMRAAVPTQPYQNVLYSVFSRPKSEWKQHVVSEGSKLTGASPVFKEAGQQLVSGEKAALRISALLGYGSIYQIPMWHSGFWITLKAPTEMQLLELHNRLDEETVRLGRLTYGMTLGNSLVFYTELVVDFALSLYYESTLTENVRPDIRKHLNVLDIPLLIWGLACTIWPKGFPYRRSCLNTDGEVFKIIKAMLNVTRLNWTDNTALTDWQKAHMAKRRGPHATPENLQNYRDQFTRGKARELKINDKVAFTLRVPSFDDYVTSGHAWINGIVTLTDKVLTEPSDTVRNTYINNNAKATYMRQYGHWVERINAGDDLVEDRETIETVMDMLSADDATRTAFIKGVRTYLEDSTISLIATPVVEGEMKTSFPQYPHLMPLDPVSTFFILLVQKNQLVVNRD